MGDRACESCGMPRENTTNRWCEKCWSGGVTGVFTAAGPLAGSPIRPRGNPAADPPPSKRQRLQHGISALLSAAPPPGDVAPKPLVTGGREDEGRPSYQPHRPSGHHNVEDTRSSERFMHGEVSQHPALRHGMQAPQGGSARNRPIEHRGHPADLQDSRYDTQEELGVKEENAEENAEDECDDEGEQQQQQQQQQLQQQQQQQHDQHHQQHHEGKLAS